MRTCLIACLALAACGTPTEQPAESCGELEPFSAGMPLHTFMALNTDRACDYEGACQFGAAQEVCNETRADLGQVECRCMDGAVKCFDNAPKVAELEASCRARTLNSCDDADPLEDGMVEAFITRYDDRPCAFAGVCRFGAPQMVCGREREDVTEVECRCMDGRFDCADQAARVAELNEACDP